MTGYIQDCNESDIQPGDSVTIGEYSAIGGSPAPSEIFDSVVLSYIDEDDQDIELMSIEPDSWELQAEEGYSRDYLFTVTDDHFVQ